MQSLAAGQETAASLPPGGTAWRVQTVPFQYSAAASETSLPTAMHADTAEQDTEVSDVIPAASGCAVQVEPFQISALAPEVPLPTAMHTVAEAHQIPDSSLRPAGDASADHDVPFQCSVSAAPAPPCWSAPTATHAVAVGQETAVKRLLVAPAGAGG